MRSRASSSWGRGVRWGWLLPVLAVFMSVMPFAAFAADIYPTQADYNWMMANFPCSAGWDHIWIKQESISTAGFFDRALVVSSSLVTSVGKVGGAVSELYPNSVGVWTEGVATVKRITPFTHTLTTLSFNSGVYWNAGWAQRTAETEPLSFGRDFAQFGLTELKTVDFISPMPDAVVLVPGDIVFRIYGAVYYGLFINGHIFGVLMDVPVGGEVVVPWTQVAWLYENDVEVYVCNNADQSDEVMFPMTFTYSEIPVGGVIYEPSGYVAKGAIQFRGKVINYGSSGVYIQDPSGGQFLVSVTSTDGGVTGTFAAAIPVSTSGVYSLYVDTVRVASTYLAVGEGGMTVPDPSGPSTDYNMGKFMSYLANAKGMLIAVFSLLPEPFTWLIPFGIGLAIFARIVGR